MSSPSSGRLLAAFIETNGEQFEGEDKLSPYNHCPQLQITPPNISVFGSGPHLAPSPPMQTTKWNDKMGIGAALEANDAQGLHDAGVRTVIDLRTEDEKQTPEKEWVESVGLDYEALPTAPDLLDDAAIARFVQEVDSSVGPVYVHCKSGGRAGIMALLYDAITHGWTVEHTLEVASEKGVKLGDDSPYRPIVEDYLRRHSAGERLKSG